MRVDQLLTTCSVLGRYYNREASDNMRNPKLIRGENAKKRGVEEGGANSRKFAAFRFPLATLAPSR